MERPCHIWPRAPGAVQHGAKRSDAALIRGPGFFCGQKEESGVPGLQRTADALRCAEDTRA